jgi:hypothetical protein
MTNWNGCGGTCKLQRMKIIMTLTSGKQYLLRGGVFTGTGEGENVTLTIESGTTIFGESATKGMLVISRGSKIIADGRADAPIVFTSDKPAGSRNRGDWGGLIINGKAPLNTGNAIVMGFQDFGLDVDHQATFYNATAGELVVDHCVFYENKKENFHDDDEDTAFNERNFATKTNKSNLEASQSPVRDAYNLRSPDFRPQGPALSHTPENPPSDGFFESVNFVGGVGDSDWTIGWTTSAPN